MNSNIKSTGKLKIIKNNGIKGQTLIISSKNYTISPKTKLGTDSSKFIFQEPSQNIFQKNNYYTHGKGGKLGNTINDMDFGSKLIKTNQKKPDDGLMGYDQMMIDIAPSAKRRPKDIKRDKIKEQKKKGLFENVNFSCFSFFKSKKNNKPKVQPTTKKIEPKIQKVQTKKNAKKPTVDKKSWEYKVSKIAFNYLNDFRKLNKKSTLIWDDSIYLVSQPHSYAMSKKKKISHDGFDKRASELEQEYFVYQSAENVAYFMKSNEEEDQKIARKLTDQWINSAGHKKNMLLDEINHAAVSIIRLLENGAYYYGTQFFVKK